MNLEAWQITVWFSALLAVTFSAGCTFGFTYARNKGRKPSNARNRNR